MSEVDEGYGFVWSVLDHEGLLSDRKNDKGGLTYRGITWNTYQSFCKTKGTVARRADLKALTDVEVLAVYVELFVNPLRLMEIENDWKREAMFSAAMNHGGVNGVRLAQGAVSTGIKVDGVLGSRTLEAINNTAATAFVNNLAVERSLFVARYVKRRVHKGDVSQVYNLVGWLTRYLRFIRPR